MNQIFTWRNGCFAKHPFKTGYLGLQKEITLQGFLHLKMMEGSQPPSSEYSISMKDSPFFGANPNLWGPGTSNNLSPTNTKLRVHQELLEQIPEISRGENSDKRTIPESKSKCAPENWSSWWFFTNPGGFSPTQLKKMRTVKMVWKS